VGKLQKVSINRKCHVVLVLVPWGLLNYHGFIENKVVLFEHRLCFAWINGEVGAVNLHV